MSINSRKLIAALRDAGYKPRSYSGRGMYGQECVGVNLSSSHDLFLLAREIHDTVDEMDLGEPETDGMGKGIIAYWPDAELRQGDLD